MAFMAAGCVGCHQVKGQFINFGPDLSVIGNKLSKDAYVHRRAVSERSS